jgi:hypothetical protein
MRILKALLFLVLVATLMLIVQESAVAQCALCKANAESSVAAGDSTARGLNAGIMYLLLIPYAIVAGLGYWWYRRNHSAEDEKA